MIHIHIMTESHEIEIRSLAFGGDGVGKLTSGKTVFLRGAAPGEVVRARLTEEKRSFARGLIQSIISPSPERVEPICDRAFSHCGGCTWMHLSLAAQRHWKQKLLVHELRRAKIIDGDEGLDSLVGGESLGYRIRCRLHTRRGLLGTLAARSHKLVPFEGCPVLMTELEELAKQLARALASNHLRTAAEVELYIDIKGNRGLHVSLMESASTKPWQRIASDLSISTMSITPYRRHRSSPYDPATGNPSRPLRESSLDRQLAFEPGIFVQSNRELNQRLVEEVLSKASSGQRFGEVYAGVGNFTVHLAQRFDSGLAFERSSAAVELLRDNLAETSPSLGMNTKAHALDDKATVRRLLTLPPLDLLVTDPPRSGMKPLRPLFTSRPPKRIIMVSCDPMTAVRDLSHLCHEAGYHVSAIVPLDLFPQTHHLELVALLER